MVGAVRSLVFIIFGIIFATSVILMYVYISLSVITSLEMAYRDRKPLLDLLPLPGHELNSMIYYLAWHDLLSGLQAPFQIFTTTSSSWSPGSYIGANVYSTMLPILWTIIFAISCIVCNTAIGHFLDKNFYLHSQPLKVMGWGLIIFYSIVHFAMFLGSDILFKQRL